MGIIAVILAGIATAIWFGISNRQTREGGGNTSQYGRTVKARSKFHQDLQPREQTRRGFELLCMERQQKELVRRRKEWEATMVAALGPQLEVESDVSPPVGYIIFPFLSAGELFFPIWNKGNFNERYTSNIQKNWLTVPERRASTGSTGIRR